MAQNAQLKATNTTEPQVKHTATSEVMPQPKPTATSEVDPEPEKACESYRIDVAAANFGDCKCGRFK